MNISQNPKRRREASPPPRLIKSEFVIVEIPVKTDVYCFTFSIALCRSNENSVKFFAYRVGRRMFVRLILRCSYCNSFRVSEIGYGAIPFLMSAFTSAHFGIIAILHDRFVLVRPENNSKYGHECRKHLQNSSNNQVIC